MKRKYVLLILVTISLILSGCGSGKKLADLMPGQTEKSTSTTVKRVAGNIPAPQTGPEYAIISQEGAMVKVIDEFKNLPHLKGHNIMVFRYININGGAYNTILSLRILKPGSKDYIDEYEYKRGSWIGPKPVQIMGNGNVAASLYPLDKIDFSKTPIIYKNIKDKMKTLENAAIIDYFTFSNNYRNEWYVNATLSTPRDRYNIQLDMNGNVLKFSKY